MAITIIHSDFEKIGIVAKHCNLQKLDIAVNEAIYFDLKPVLCGLFLVVSEKWDDVTDEAVKNIVLPKKYDGCGGKETEHQGLKKVLLYYAYARYILINNFDDTGSGAVQKTNDFSIPKPLKELQSVANQKKEMAIFLFNEVQAYICKNKEEYSEYDFSRCAPCGCGSGSCGSPQAVRPFFKSRNLRKRL